MKPTKFKEQNKVLKGFPSKHIKDLSVFTDGEIIMSCWKMSFIERFKALFFGKVWLQVRSEKTHPPVTLICNRTGFESDA